MTDAVKLRERREYIKYLLDAGENIDSAKIKTIAKEWGSSFTTIMNDLSVVQYDIQHYEKDPTTGQNTRARKLGVSGELTPQDWSDVLRKYHHRCAACGSYEDLSIDHIIPLSRGGTNTADNIQPLCRSCNCKKGNATADKPATRGRGLQKGGRPRRDKV